MQDLIQGCINKDTVAQEKFYDKYKKQVFRTALLFTRNQDLAEDVTQETFIRIFEKISLYNSNYSLDTWLYKVVTNVARNIIRKHKKEFVLNPFEYFLEKKSKHTPVTEFESKEQQKLLMSMITGLPYKQQEVIILKYYNGFSQEEISSILEIPLGTVKSRINSGLKKLRKSIESQKSIKEEFVNERV